MSIAMYPGSFDPITKGHLDIIKRASNKFEHLIISIMVNPKKKATFSAIERKKLIKLCTKDIKNISIIIDNGLTIKLAQKHKVDVLIRGIRAVTDYELELQQASVNMALDESIETLFLISKPEYSFLSSSSAKELASLKGDITSFIPPQIIKSIQTKFK